jgi:hypothetical protein
MATAGHWKSSELRARRVQIGCSSRLGLFTDITRRTPGPATNITRPDGCSVCERLVALAAHENARKSHASRSKLISAVNSEPARGVTTVLAVQDDES